MAQRLASLAEGSWRLLREHGLLQDAPHRDRGQPELSRDLAPTNPGGPELQDSFPLFVGYSWTSSGHGGPSGSTSVSAGSLTRRSSAHSSFVSFVTMPMF